MKMIKDNLAGQELRISSDAIDIVVDCCGGRILILITFLCCLRHSVKTLQASYMTFHDARGDQLCCRICKNAVYGSQ